MTYYSDKNFDVDSFRYDTDKAKVILIMDAIDDNEKLLDKICLKGGYDKLELLTRNGLDFGVRSYLIRKD